MKTILIIILALLFTPAYARPTDAEFEQAIQSTLARIKGDHQLLELVASMPLKFRKAFIVDVALVELLKMENSNKESKHGKAKEERF